MLNNLKKLGRLILKTIKKLLRFQIKVDVDVNNKEK